MRRLKDLYEVRRREQTDPHPAPRSHEVGVTTSTTTTTYPDGRVEVRSVTTQHDAGRRDRCVLYPVTVCADVRSDGRAWCDFCARTCAPRRASC